MSMLILAPIIPFTLTRRITIEFHVATHIPLRITKHLSNLVMDFWEMEIEMRPWPNKSPEQTRDGVCLVIHGRGSRAAQLLL